MASEQHQVFQGTEKQQEADRSPGDTDRSNSSSDSSQDGNKLQRFLARKKDMPMA